LTGNPETILFIIYLLKSQVKIDERRPNLLGSRFLEGFQAYSGRFRHIIIFHMTDCVQTLTLFPGSEGGGHWEEEGGEGG